MLSALLYSLWLARVMCQCRYGTTAPVRRSGKKWGDPAQPAHQHGFKELRLCCRVPGGGWCPPVLTYKRTPLVMLFSSNRVITVAELRNQRLAAKQPRCPSGRWWPCPKWLGRGPRPMKPTLLEGSCGGRRGSSGWVTTRAPAVQTSLVNLCPAVPSNLSWWRLNKHPQMDCRAINLSQVGDTRRSKK